MKKLYSLLLAFAVCITVTACGGNTEFILQRSSYDAENMRFTNTVTGLTLTLPQGYYYSTEEYMAENYFLKTVEEMNAMTQEDYACMDFVPDYIVADDNNTVEVRYLNTAILLSEMENPTEDDYLEKLKAEKIRQGTAEEAFEKTTVSLGGVPYSVLTMRFSNEKISYVMVHKISENYMTCIIASTENGVNIRYFEDMFNGGVNVTDTENVPVRSELDETEYIYTNSSTGVIFKVPVGWYYSTDADIASEYYNSDMESLSGVTAENWAKINEIVDFYSYNSNNRVVVAFENISVQGAGYGLGETEYLDKYISQQTEKGWYCDTETSTVSFADVDFSVNSLWAYENDVLITQHMAVKKINEDYICLIGMTTAEDSAVEDFRAFFSEQRNNTGIPDGRIARSEYYEKTGRFYNPVTDLTIEIPDGWQLKDSDFIAERYYSAENLTGSDVDNMTAEEMARWDSVADFIAYNGNDSMEVFYKNINYGNTDLTKKTFDEYMAEITDAWSSAEGVVLNDSFTIEFETKRFSCIDADVNDQTGAYNTYLIFTQVDEDYVMCLRADTQQTGTIDDFLFLIYEGNLAK